MTSDPVDLDPCPYCGGISRVWVIPDTPPRVRAWSCGECRTDWAVSVVNPRPFLDHLAATVELAAARSVLRELIALADPAPVLTDDQLRFRLRALAVRAAPRSTAVPPDPRPTAGRALMPPDSAPGGRSAPDSAPAQTPADHRSSARFPVVSRFQPLPPMPTMPISQGRGSRR